ncbi:hypothetical protein A0J61_09301 [Choanephora cucurbitarum]|uniref:Uncharacterized protein n=1 Tax=Choanephora cucurbitarum TaxID=101091 RepID=A0A1C7N0M0_9FUNG|nr:hypothetical protein A0J61_09301 [Choanephora cucurbitarum]
MFPTKNNRPFYTNKSSRKRQKWLWRMALVSLLCLLYIVSRTFSTSSTSPSAFRIRPSHTHRLEVQLEAPSRSEQFKELAIAKQTKLVPVGTSIPKIVHFVYGMRDPNPTLDLIHYLSIKSAHDRVKPDKIMFHYHHKPVGDYFERALPMLTLNQVDMVETIFDRPVSHYAHRADVVRLQVLQEYGGIYFDLDVISLKSLDHLLNREFIMAQEGISRSNRINYNYITYLESLDGAVGLCNAMIMARPHSRFLQRWYATYASFDYNDWNYHSVILPGKLAPHFSKEITVLNHTSYFWPLWDSHGLRTLFLEKSYDFSANLGTHIWESAANKNLMRDLDEQVIMEIDNSLYCQLRPFLLDGKPDPRPGSCRILSHSEREDGLIGHWPLSNSDSTINPLPAHDISGHQLTGLIRNGRYTEHGVSLSGDTSYIFLTMPIETAIQPLTVGWWMKTTTQLDGRMVMVVQTDHGRLCITTHAGNQGTVMEIKTIHRDETWTWAPIDSLTIRPTPYLINDDQYHHYMLVVDPMANARGEPALVLYMDRHVVASRFGWQLPKAIGTLVKGIWFGSIEPLNDKYQDPWDNSVSLEAEFRDIQVWERSLNVTEALKQMSLTT